MPKPLSESAVIDPSSRGLAVLHRPVSSDDYSPMSPLFGSRSDARRRAEREQGCSFETALLDIRNPVEVRTSIQIDSIDVLQVALSLEGNILTTPVRQWAELQQAVERSGYDGICIQNADGAVTWLPVRSEQILRLCYADMATSKDPSEMSLEDYIGESFVGPFFGFDGDSEDYQHLWEALREDRDTLPIVATHEGRTVRLLPDWEPFVTVGLYNTEGCPKGFYMGGQAWVDPDERGQHLSAFMIDAAARIRGQAPALDDDQGSTGYSESGHRAHIFAWALAVPKEESAFILSHYV